MVFTIRQVEEGKGVKQEQNNDNMTSEQEEELFPLS